MQHTRAPLPVNLPAIVVMSAGLRESFVAEQPRTVVTTTPSTLEGWAAAHLRPLL